MGYKINKTKVKKAIPGTFGIYNRIAHKLGVDRITIMRYMRKYPDLKALADEEKEETVDLAESQAITKIKEGDTTMIWKVLSTLGKVRGYGEKQEIEHSGSMGVMTAEDFKKAYQEAQEEKNGEE